MKKLNWGIIGVGWIAHEMADALNQVNGEIYAATAPTAAHLAKFAAEKHVLHTYTNADTMLNDPNVDVVYIATPHTFHYEYIKKALLAGKHVFCEKAITVNAHQFDEVAALARKKNLILSEGFTLYHMPIYKQVKDLINAGKLGEIHMIQVNFGSLKDYDVNNRFFSKELAGGALLDIGGYATAFARYFMDEQPNAVQTMVKFFETGVDEQSGIIMKNTREQMAVMALSMRAKQPKRGSSAHGETHTTLTAGVSADALVYEVQDMQRYIEQGHDDGELALSHDVAHLLDSVRTAWGMRYPFDNK
ncbi:Gfo/Idh/MocA family oxidoreductase [Ligilactobacillus saerimneri]|uniref:Gfo/Idh/MocA family protein n=1 Tax=Ligilactobacillus saerimneri TaxID=228229 RepID=UPI0022A7ACC8|nr:Gfo/Idh/MocA family oxidoreductase [Ligilactobacillus saerimneri]MCZ0891747.1 Gfo/Idh/MocA family oxidoreductase [Ligilactobacillus saerimneri]